MSPAGYSGTALPTKLGIKPEHRVLLAGAAEDFSLDPLPGGVTVHRRAAGSSSYDVIVAFCPSQAVLARRFGTLRTRLDPAGGLWIAWPKRSSGVTTDLTDHIVRETGLTEGLVDNKVCAIDGVWSGLRFVVRLVDRPV